MDASWPASVAGWSWGKFEASFEEELVTNMTYADQMHEARREGEPKGLGNVLVWGFLGWIPSGKRLHRNGKLPFLLGNLTISMAIFNSYVANYQRVW